MGIMGGFFNHNDENNLMTKLLLVNDIKAKLKIMGINSQSFIKSWSFEQICEAIEEFTYSINN